MGERIQFLKTVIEEADTRKIYLVNKADKAESEVASAILHLTVEICELEKLIAVYLVK